MANANAETNWVPPGLPAPGPGEPCVEMLISVAEGRARNAPWAVIAESRDLDFDEIQRWPWKFPRLWNAYLDKALKLQLQFQVASSLIMLEALQNSGTGEEIRRACETVLHYDTMMELINHKTSNHQDTKNTKNYETADERRLTPTEREMLDYKGQDDERAFLPRLPVLMPRGPNRSPRRPARRCALPTPEALAVLREQLADPDPKIAHRAARTTLIHDARLRYIEAKYGSTETADERGYTQITEEQLSVASSLFSVIEEGAESDDWTKDIAPDITPEERARILEQIELNAEHDPMLRKALEIIRRPIPPESPAPESPDTS